MPTKKSRRDLVLQYIPKDIHSYTSVFNFFYQPLCDFAQNFIDDPQAAQDVVSEVFIQFWEKAGTFDNFYKIKAWLYTSTKNACLSHSQRNKYRPLTNSLIEEMQTHDIALNKIIWTEVLHEIKAEADVLPGKCKQIFELSFIEGHSNEEIADMMHLSLQTVKNQKVKALKRIREKLKASQSGL
ncbi:MAG: RNA polymerase sigma-70 factor [Chitinophagaceae bacterium]